jgi:hypothetical protein
VRFEPVKLNFSKRTIFEADARAALEFPPVPLAEEAVEACQDTDSAAARNRFDRLDFTDNFKLHWPRFTYLVGAGGMYLWLRRAAAGLTHSSPKREAEQRRAEDEPRQPLHGVGRPFGRRVRRTNRVISKSTTNEMNHSGNAQAVCSSAMASGGIPAVSTYVVTKNDA